MKVDTVNLDRLTHKVADTSFECGAWEDPQEPDALDQYRELAKNAELAREALRAYVLSLEDEE